MVRGVVYVLVAVLAFLVITFLTARPKVDQATAALVLGTSVGARVVQRRVETPADQPRVQLVTTRFELDNGLFGGGRRPQGSKLPRCHFIDPRHRARAVGAERGGR